jgi:hypothetical protein
MLLEQGFFPGCVGGGAPTGCGSARVTSKLVEESAGMESFAFEGAAEEP